MNAISWPAFGTTVTVQTIDPSALPSARRLVELCLRAGEKAADAGRPRSEVARLSRAGGRPVTVSPLLADLLLAAVDAAEASDGLCDPTVGTATARARHRSAIRVGAPLVPVCGASPATGGVSGTRDWRSLQLSGRRLHLPAGTEVDLSATAKPFLAIGAAAFAARTCGTGVLVELGGAVATSGPAPLGGWRVGLDAGSSLRLHPGQSVVTSRGRGVIDPRTGGLVSSPWRRVSVIGSGCIGGAALAIGAHVLGLDGADWLAEQGVEARLVRRDGGVAHLGHDRAGQLASAS